MRIFFRSLVHSMEERPKRLFNIYGEYGTGFAGNVWATEYISPTIETCGGGNRQPLIMENNNRKRGDAANIRIRKLTPKECWRLMGFDDEDYEKASKVCSDTQLYRQAGNSIVVQTLMELFRCML